MNNLTQIFQGCQNYFKDCWKTDLAAGLTVAMVAIPQSMAYASIAGVNPIYGLYTAIIPAIVASLFGSSSHLVTGPTNAIALTTSGVLIMLIGQDSYTEYVFLLSIASGAIMLVLGLLRLGWLVRLMSNAVLTGFLTGAAFLIILNQIVNLLGLPPADTHTTQGVLHHLFAQLGQVNWLVLAIGAANIILILIGRKLWSRLPSAMITILLTSGIVQLFHWDSRGVHIIGDFNNIGQIGLRFHIPSVPFPMGQDMFQTIWVGASAIAMISLVEALSVAKAIGLQTGQRIDASREFVGQGLASLIGGFFQAIPTSGSLTRSAINFGSGAVTRVAGILSGVFVLVAMLLLKSWIIYIPIVSLSGIVIISALQLIDVGQLRIVWFASPRSWFVLITTFITVLFLPIQVSIFLGMVLSISLYLFESSKVDFIYMEPTSDGQFVEVNFQDLQEKQPRIMVVNLDGALYFAAVEDLENKFHQTLDSDVEVIILRLRNTRLVGSTAMTSLGPLIQHARREGVTILFSGVPSEIAASFRKSGVSEIIGEDHIFIATPVPYQSTHKAYELAQNILA
jgi:sulfate permease, SulP family